MKCLAVILFHNDEDLVEDQLDHMIANNHDILVFDHCSTDRTREIIEKNKHRLLAYFWLGPEFVFQNNEVFVHISQVLRAKYSHYDWISFVESDEFLQGPDRTKSYYQHLLDVHKTKYTWITFDNFVFWFTEKDDPTIKSPRQRIKHYAYKSKCGTRVYAWRGNVTNERYFNHNPPELGTEANKYPIPFRTCHYEMRSAAQAKAKLEDRVKKIDEMLEQVKKNKNARFPPNIHYKIMHNKLGNLNIHSSKLHYDNGGELIADELNDFSSIYNNNEMEQYRLNAIDTANKASTANRPKSEPKTSKTHNNIRKYQLQKQQQNH